MTRIHTILFEFFTLTKKSKIERGGVAFQVIFDRLQWMS